MNQYLKLGDLLVSEGLITNLQLTAVLTAQKASRRRIGDVLVERGLVTEEQITECLAKQYGYPIASLSRINPQPDALLLIDPEIALSYGVLPLSVTDEGLQCVIADPVDIVGTDYISHVVKRRLLIEIAPKAKLLSAIQKAYAECTTADTEANRSVTFPPERFKDARARKRLGEIVLFDAFDTWLNRHVTLSVVRTGTTEEQEHFARAQACSRATAKGTVAVHDSFEHDGHRFVVFESLEGETLAEVLANRGARSVMQAAEMIADLAEGLDALNRAGNGCAVVCPENILIRWNGALLIPFSAPPSEYNGPGSEKGHHASTDVFALGTLLWEAATGQNPHQTKGDTTIWADPAQMKRLPHAMREILKSCLDLDPHGRYATTLQLANALRSYGWASTTFTVTEGGAENTVQSTRDREELLQMLTFEDGEERKPFWKRLFDWRKAA